MTPDPATTEIGVKRALAGIALVGAVVVLASLAMEGSEAALSAFAGAGLAVANLWVLGRLVRGFFGGSGPRAPWGLVALVKSGLLFVGAYALFRAGVMPLYLALGYASLPVGVVLCHLRLLPESTGGSESA
ncbi:MAG TPA: hypothetical protein VF989_12075 [Polyangiaceae bacterium]